jgi:hypothetical protein
MLHAFLDQIEACIVFLFNVSHKHISIGWGPKINVAGPTSAEYSRFNESIQTRIGQSIDMMADQSQDQQIKCDIL